MKTFKIPVYLYALTAMLFWGMSFIWTSSLLKYYQPVTIILIRLVISATLLFGILSIFRPQEKLERKDFKLILLSALFNPFLYFLGESYGLKYSTPTISAVIIATIPVFSPLIGYISFREKLAPVNFIGIAVSFGGILLMIVSRNLSLATDIRGVLFLFGAVLSALMYSVTLRKLTGRYSALLLIAWQNMLGVFLFLPYFLIFEMSELSGITLNGEIVSAFLLLSVLASSIAFVFYAHSVKLLGISKANIFSNLIPVFTAFFSWFLIDEQFTGQKIAGIFLVIGGVYLSERTKRRT